jgi:hypothetical protein
MTAAEQLNEFRTAILADALSAQWSVAHPGPCNCEQCRWQWRAAMTDKAVNTIGDLLR